MKYGSWLTMKFKVKISESIHLRVIDLNKIVGVKIILKYLKQHININLHLIKMATNNTSTLTLRSVLEKDKLNGKNFLDWHRNLRIVLK